MIVVAAMLVSCGPEPLLYQHKFHEGDVACMKLTGERATVVSLYSNDFVGIRPTSQMMSYSVHEFELESCRSGANR